MASKLQALSQMADHTATQITGSYQKWTAFLTTAARLYKYPYHEQLMIFAQRPDATACAEYDLWNDKMGRYVRRGSQGIAIIDATGDNPKLRYVFDISDTGGGEHSRRPALWEYRQEHQQLIMERLGENYDVPSAGEFAVQIECIAAQLADEYWNEHQRDILGIVDGSFLEEYDDFNIGVQFRTAATMSIAYAVMSRCGLNPDEYFAHEDFLSIFDWNTPAAVAALGTAVSQINQQVLRQIGITIQNYERENGAERSNTDGKQLDLSAQRGLSDPQPDLGRAEPAAPGQVREDAPGISEGASSGDVQQSASVGEAVSAPSGDRRDGPEPDGVDDAGADAVSGRDGGAESQRSDEVDGADEHPQDPSGGNHPDRAGAQLTDAPTQLSLFPTEQQQIRHIAEAESVKPSAFAISQEEIDAELWRGTSYGGGKLRVYALYQHSPDAKEAVKFIKEEYGWYGHSHTFLDGTSGYVDYRPAQGMKIERYATHGSRGEVERHRKAIADAGL